MSKEETLPMLDDNGNESIAIAGVTAQEGDLFYPEVLGRNFLTYAVSVLTDRALPDVRDGLLPVQRRILLAMNDLRLRSNGAHRKSAKVVGECFIAGSLVHTPNGMRRIEDIAVGDEVLTPGGEVTLVTEEYRNPPTDLVDVRLANGNTITSTPEQLFLALDPDGEPEWVYADHLQGRAVTGSAENALAVVAVTPHPIARETYDIQVAHPEHAFLVAGCAVHNCMGNYHPHGDLAIYGALVRMAQDFSLRVPLIDGQGNYGNLDGDNAAASRYTECKMAPAAERLLEHLDPQVLPDDYGRNYDESRPEPHVLPAAYPNLLVNGNIGIAVGMTCKMMPHNPSEILDLASWRAQNPEAPLEQVVKRLSGPDFPTGALVVNDDGLRQAYSTGEGKVTVLGEAHIEPLPGNREKIVITSLPYGVSKGSGGKGTGILEVMAKQFAEGKFPEWTELTDLSEDNTRIEIELKRGSNARAVLQRIYKHTRLRETFGVQMNVLVHGRPRTLNLAQVLDEFLAFRRYVLIKIAEKRIAEIEVRLHKLDALIKALDAIDAVVKTIRSSKSRAEAKPKLQKLLKIDERQSEWIVEMPLGNLTSLETRDLKEEQKTLAVELKTLQKFIKTPELVTEQMIEDFKGMKKHLAQPRQTKLVAPETDGGASITDFSVPAEDCVLLVSRNGQALCGAGTMKRGAAMQIQSSDRIAAAVDARTDQDWIVFTASGKAFRLRLAELPLENKRAKGQHLSEIIGIEQNDSVVGVQPLDKKRAGAALFVYNSGLLKRTEWSEFAKVVPSGIVAATPKPGEEVVGIYDCPEAADVVLVGTHGKGIRFATADLRLMGRSAAGVRGITLPGGAELAGHGVLADASEQVLLLTDTRFGKRIPNAEFPSQGRGGGGVTLMKTGGKYGAPRHIAVCNDKSELWLQRDGKLQEYPIKKIATAGRAITPKLFEPAATTEVVLVRVASE